jgi:hypothetical protein
VPGWYDAVEVEDEQGVEGLEVGVDAAEALMALVGDLEGVAIAAGA